MKRYKPRVKEVKQCARCGKYSVNTVSEYHREYCMPCVKECKEATK